jgi:hypothetical protein
MDAAVPSPGDSAAGSDGKGGSGGAGGAVDAGFTGTGGRVDSGGSGGSSGCAATLDQTTWDPNVDYSSTENPCGVWTYGYTRTLGSAPLVIYSAKDGIYWVDPGNETLFDPAAWQKDGTFNLHPGPKGEYSTVRWTAPRDGTYSVTVAFLAGDKGETDGAVLQGTYVLFESSTTSNPHYAAVLTMAAGETLDVAVGLVPPVSASSYLFGTTPISLVITDSPGLPGGAVPHPG